MIGIRNQYSLHGVDRFYIDHAEEYHNPHQRQIACLLIRHIREMDRSTRFLDLCCGDGLVTEILQSKQFENIEGCDPFMFRQYEHNTETVCHRLDFKDIAQGKLQHQYDVIICSFALHLCPISLLPDLSYQLSRIASTLIVISPSKYPLINTFCWHETCHSAYQKVHLRKFEGVGR